MRYCYHQRWFQPSSQQNGLNLRVGHFLLTASKTSDNSLLVVRQETSGNSLSITYRREETSDVSPSTEGKEETSDVSPPSYGK